MPFDAGQPTAVGNAVLEVVEVGLEMDDDVPEVVRVDAVSVEMLWLLILVEPESVEVGAEEVETEDVEPRDVETEVDGVDVEIDAEDLDTEEVETVEGPVVEVAPEEPVAVDGDVLTEPLVMVPVPVDVEIVPVDKLFLPTQYVLPITRNQQSGPIEGFHS